MVIGLLPSMIDMSVGHSIEWTNVRAISILGMEAPGQLPGSLSVVLSSHSDVIEGCVPT